MTISRRTVLQAGVIGGGMALLPLGMVKKAWAAPAKTLVRYNVLSPEGQKMLKIYAGAVKKMMAKPATDPLSWTFQWYIHAIPDVHAGDKSKTVDKVFGGAASPQKALAQSAWWTCEPHASGNSDAFLPWHRMYVMYFEQIIREVSGEAEFTLPFWDYTGPYSAAGNNYSVMPKEFLLKDDPVFGSLYRPDRNPGSNAGKPVVDFGSSLDLACMKWRDYSSKIGFCSNIDNNPHGSLHDDVGNGKGMGEVPWAANDPVFWIHHANIDRIWASWIKSGGQNPNTGSFLNQTWTFADASGKAVKIKTADVLDTTKLASPYVYSEYAQRPQGSLPFASGEKKFLLLAQSAPPATASAITLGGKPITVALSVGGAPAPAANAGKSAAHTFSAQVKALPAVQEYALSFEAIAASSAPGNAYNVYLGLPEGKAPTSEYLVGTISMFGVGAHKAHHGSSKSASFLVGEQLQVLLKAGEVKEAPSVTLVPVGEPAPGSAPTIGNISLSAI
ncbi:tyrosinase [Pseudomonas asplenii]|uniref:Tyrosinase n=1 Tax=Pseudomonas asplenii TaxID=53407 RepID=A0A1H1X1U7_9PSED|nr:tyrosinase family protein [Pseudomonas asplenii]SDT03337.1 tyrosinase [Pseudomonas asplenii]